MKNETATVAKQGADYRSHHYVPQFLLQAWCMPDPRRNDKRLRQIGRRPHIGGPRVSPKTPRGVACIDDLYTIQLAERVSRSLERDYFGPRIDNGGSQAHATLVAMGVDGLDDAARENWARFLCAQMARTPAMVKLLERQVAMYAGEVTVEALLAGLEEPEREIVVGLIEEIGDGVKHDARAWLITVITALVRTRPFYSSRWLIRDLSGACSELLLGDNPLILSSHDGDRDFICALPLAPRQLFLAATNDASIAGLKKVSADNLVKETNRFTVTQASASVFATNGDLQDFVVKHLRN